MSAFVTIPESTITGGMLAGIDRELGGLGPEGRKVPVETPPGDFMPTEAAGVRAHWWTLLVHRADLRALRGEPWNVPCPSGDVESSPSERPTPSGWPMPTSEVVAALPGGAKIVIGGVRVISYDWLRWTVFEADGSYWETTEPRPEPHQRRTFADVRQQTGWYRRAK